MSKNIPIHAHFAGDQGSYQYLEVKQLAEILGRHRIKVRENLKMCRRLKRDIAQEKDPVERLYMSYESAYIRCHLRDAYALYRRVYHDFQVAYTSYMTDLSAQAATWAPYDYKSQSAHMSSAQGKSAA